MWLLLAVTFTLEMHHDLTLHTFVGVKMLSTPDNCPYHIELGKRPIFITEQSWQQLEGGSGSVL